jgi:hypothetical protein
MLAALVAALAVGTPPVKTSVDVWGQAARSAETVPAHLRVLRRSQTAADALPGGGPFTTLAGVASRMHAGRLRGGASRRIDTSVGPVYLAPTASGWLCVQLPNARTCHRGLLRQRVTWSFYTTNPGLEVVGVAADDVARVTLAFAGRTRSAVLRDNVFTVSRPLTVASTQLPPLGRLLVRYRDGSTAVVPLR